MKNEMMKDNVGNLLLAIGVGVSCMYIILAADVLSITTALVGLFTGGAVFCIGYLGKLLLLGGEKRRKKGRELFWKLFFGFWVSFIVAVVLV